MSDPEGRQPEPPAHGGRRRVLVAAATAVFALAGVGLIGSAALGQQSPPQPAHTAAGSGPGSAPSSTTATPHQQSSTSTTTPSPYLPASKPTQITIPAIGVHAKVMTLGLKKDGSIQVPPFQ
ncbi:MAG: hypothetical protein ACRDMV_05700, partial [Streptosporangiales bacterium]